jgi:hypothetical protein
MGKERIRLVAKLDRDEIGRAARNKGIRSSRRRSGSLVVEMASILALLATWPFAPLARSQDTPAKSETLVQPGVRQDLAPPETAQEPLLGSAEALSVRYRFIEKYSVEPQPDHPELLSQYVVAIEEIQKSEREKPQGAPERFQFSHLTKYTERPAQVSKLGQALSAVRRYDRFRIKQSAAAPAPKKAPFEGLTVLYQRRTGQKPRFLSLTSDRPLREFEYSAMVKQVFIPQLTELFALTPPRVGDTWRISPKATQLLVTELPDTEDYEMNGRLIDVRKSATGTALTAVIGISGQMNLSLGKSVLNAQIHFVFEPAPAVAPSSDSGASARSAESTAVKSRAKNDAGIVNARGWISRVLMAWVVSSPIDDGDGRLKQTVTYELNLERRLSSVTNDAAGTQNTLLPIPDPLPAADQSNSWLVHDDPLGRFHFRHPQELTLSPEMIDSRVVEFVNQDHEGGRDGFILLLPPGAADPQGDRAYRDPEKFQRDIEAQWAKKPVEILRGPVGWLPEGDWAPMKVFRKELGFKKEAADQAGPKSERCYCDFYLILSKRNECLQAQSWTIRDDHVTFRNDVERMIKSVTFGPLDSPPKAPTNAPSPPPTSPG